MFSAFWDSSDTPDDILAELNSLGGAGLLLASASENIEHIARLAGIVGKQITDFLPEDQWVPRRAFIPTESGVTLAPPADGYDAWGKLIPIIEEPIPIIDEPIIENLEE